MRNKTAQRWSVVGMRSNNWGVKLGSVSTGSTVSLWMSDWSEIEKHGEKKN